jgi:3-methyladenine DNA glycosylase AlkD
MKVAEAVRELRRLADPSRRPGMSRVGIDVEHALGVSVPNIRRIARRAGTDQDLALRLWRTGIHEARILAVLVADPVRMTADDRERWVVDIGSWDVCDFAADLFGMMASAERTIRAWARRPEPYVKRCAFSMIARAAVREKGWPDERFERFFPLIVRAAVDDRNEVKKAVNWALRQIGKRSRTLHTGAIDVAEGLLALDSRSARWIARDALRELRDPRIAARL